MQEPLLIARPESKKFTTISEYKKTRPEWQNEYPRGLLWSAILCIFGSFVLYILPWPPFLFLFLHKEDSMRSLLVFGLIWVCFIILALLFSSRNQAVYHVNLQPILLPLYVSGVVALLVTLFSGADDLFVLHRFQAVPLAGSTILFLVGFWPYFSFLFHIAIVNADKLLHRFSKKEVLRTAFASQSLDMSKDRNPPSS